tara:strand:+ start:38 stop:352 length:315 start_codon:yes stop_codon:yes gene_type:complete
MAFKMKGFSGFKKNGKNGKRGYDTDNYEKREEEQQRIAKNQDPPSGRSKKEEMAYDMRMTKKEIKRFEKQGNNRAIGMLKSALERQKKAYIELYGKLPGMGTFE